MKPLRVLDWRHILEEESNLPMRQLPSFSTLYVLVLMHLEHASKGEIQSSLQTLKRACLERTCNSVVFLSEFNVFCQIVYHRLLPEGEGGALSGKNTPVFQRVLAACHIEDVPSMHHACETEISRMQVLQQELEILRRLSPLFGITGPAKSSKKIWVRVWHAILDWFRHCFNADISPAHEICVELSFRLHQLILHPVNLDRPLLSSRQWLLAIYDRAIAHLKLQRDLPLLQEESLLSEHIQHELDAMRQIGLLRLKSAQILYGETPLSDALNPLKEEVRQWQRTFLNIKDIMIQESSAFSEKIKDLEAQFERVKQTWQASIDAALKQAETLNNPGWLKRMQALQCTYLTCMNEAIEHASFQPLLLPKAEETVISVAAPADITEEVCLPRERESLTQQTARERREDEAKIARVNAWIDAMVLSEKQQASLEHASEKLSQSILNACRHDLKVFALTLKAQDQEAFSNALLGKIKHLMDEDVYQKQEIFLSLKALLQDPALSEIKDKLAICFDPGEQGQVYRFFQPGLASVSFSLREKVPTSG